MMKLIIAAPLLFFWCLPAVQSSNVSTVTKGQIDSTTQIKAQAVTGLKEDDSENEDEQDHRTLYIRPPWLGRLELDPTIINLKRCFLRPFAPPDGSGCGKKAKTCYWGNQVCPDGSPYPTTECFCNGNGVSRGTWSCIDPLSCPVDSTDSPSTAPTSKELPSSFPSTSTTPTPSDNLGSISGNVKGDTVGDDIGDVNLEGVPILLLDSTGSLVATTETDSNGNYVFYDLPAPGSYGVRETNIASFPLDVSDIDGGDNNNIAPVMIGGPNPVNSTGNDFVDCPTRTISGVVLEDTNGDGVGDIPIPNVPLSIVDDDGVEVAVIQTDVNGEFSVEVPKGVYTVLSTNLIGFIDVSDSDGGNPNEITADVRLADKGDLVFVDAQ